MRRAPIVITATVLGTAGVLLFKPIATTSVVDSSTGDSSSSTNAASAPSSSSSASSSATPSTSAGPSSSNAKNASSARNGTYTGAAETVQFGTTQVKATIQGGKITAVTVLEYNSNDPRSQGISENAIPILRSEVLSKQTAAVDTVSGATYTSAQYEASLQSALDKADFTAADGKKASTDVSNIQE